MTAAWQPDEAGLEHLTTLLKDPDQQTFGVLGLGITGESVSRLLLARGARVRAADARLDSAPTLEGGLAKSAQARLTIKRGVTPANYFDKCQILVASPGVMPTHKAIVRALARGTPVIGELELACEREGQTRVAVVTGTNGKSTTTSLIGSLLGPSSSADLFVGGNLGVPIGTWLSQWPVPALAVLEISSYQLDLNYRFRADVACILNVSADHLARYQTFDAYAASKARLAEQVAPHGTLILNYDDHVVRRMADLASTKVWWLATGPDGLPEEVDGLFLRDDCAIGSGALASFGRMPLGHTALLGRHNRENALAALAVALALKPELTPEILSPRYASFFGLPHRLELVCERDGVRFVNDSKATNDAAAAIAIWAMNRPALVLMGGRDKNGGYALALEACRARLVREVFAYGEAAEAIAQACMRAEQPVRRAPDLLTAARLAAETAHAGDVVLLAPACSSFDAYADYIARGEAFAHFARSWHARAQDAGQIL